MAKQNKKKEKEKKKAEKKRVFKRTKAATQQQTAFFVAGDLVKIRTASFAKIEDTMDLDVVYGTHNMGKTGVVIKQMGEEYNTMRRTMYVDDMLEWWYNGSGRGPYYKVYVDGENYIYSRQELELISEAW